MVVAALLIMAAWLGSWLSDLARAEAAEASGLPLEQVEADGLDIHLIGLGSVDELEEAVAAVEALDSSRRVTAALTIGADGPDAGDEDPAEVAAPSDPAAAADADDDTEDDVDEPVGPIEQPGDAEPGPAVVTATFGPDGVALDGALVDRSTADRVVAAAIGELGAAKVDATLDADTVTAGGTLRIVGAPASAAERGEWRAAAEAMATVADLELLDELDQLDVAAALNQLVALEPIEFEPRQARLTAASQRTLDEAAALLLDDPAGPRLRIVGHTDSDGSASRNVDLSARRAQAVADYLIAVGVDPAQLETEGRGEADLLVSPEVTQADKQRNRRIEWEPLP